MTRDEVVSIFSNYLVYRRLFAPSTYLKAVRALVGGRDGYAPPPFMACWLTTFACNATCEFCNVKRFLGEKHELLSASFLEGFARTFSVFAIGGGEPFARRDMYDLLRVLKKAGVRTLIITNGMLITPEKAAELAEIGPEMVMFSVHGGAAFHDGVMGQKGAWDKTFRGLKALLAVRRAPMRVVVNCVVEDNVDELRAVAQALRDVGVDAVRYTLVSFMTDAEVARSRSEGLIPATYVRPDPPTVDAASLLAEMRSLRKEFGAFVSFHPYLKEPQLAAWFREGGGMSRGCSVLRHSLFVKPDGTVVPCPYLLDHPMGNVREQPLEDIWNGPDMRALRQRRDLAPFTVCARCCKT